VFRKFFDKLAGAIKRAWNWLKGTPPAKFIAKCYNKALDITAVPMLKIFYGGRRRCKVFGSTLGQWVVRAIWTVVVTPLTVGVMAYELLKPPVKLVTKVTLTVVAYAWAALTVLWTLEVAVYYWAINTVLNWTVRGLQWTWAKITGVPTKRRYTRYIPIREALAFELSALVWVHAGPARLFRRAIGDKPTWFIVQKVTDAAARLHPPTYDWWFGKKLPYDTPQDGGDTYALIVQDVPAQWHLEPELSEEEKSANFFLANGFVLIATDAPDKSDTEVFNEYMRERWANLNAAEVATDEFGRTWVVPFSSQPLFRDVSTETQVPRIHADQEVAWMSTDDPVHRSYSYGRHWAASLADQEPEFVENKDMRVRERARFYSKFKGRRDLHIEHLLRGYDAWVGEHTTVAETVTT
jgi:hypothetical protein